MESVIDALKAMKKATYREVAARLDIEPVEALNMLREHKQQGLCDFFDGAWSVGTAKEQARELAKAPAVTPAHQAPRLKGEIPTTVDPDVVRQLLGKNGSMATAALAAAVNRNARGMVSVMLAFERQGVVIKNGKGKGVTWSLPVTGQTETDNTEAVQPEPGTLDNELASSPDSKSLNEIIGDIPAFTARPDDLIIPSSRFISNEIRRTKAKLSNLQRLQGAVRELRRHKHLLQGMGND
ncbi:DUF1627 domain-containing protein [Cronobacter sakazakii]|uniref:DUF1627 domain-containing protein n=1 Tax=Cronobacter sakazakii TaxID=28141 RepID=UPI000CFB586D|nr:DUF1627 domain-containing protein [Cronobacter sakazakii]EIZ9234827.1 DUF1627 domain-containing protein [Cronobacter sakazakii]ELY2470814.1 DUF1627 domain-containing protein [Cronobacter sakazakii]ELY2661066.1 DUF1627 domain-containing protein [Cronobacter sakazakii]ELY4040614.1 DUF1627 domain-containing protein [Cronobacter sakazakii]ELY6284182.1 DUF1627 domain-containing protein [Cronobacter sakazakii]